MSERKVREADENKKTRNFTKFVTVVAFQPTLLVCCHFFLSFLVWVLSYIVSLNFVSVPDYGTENNEKLRTMLGPYSS